MLINRKTAYLSQSEQDEFLFLLLRLISCQHYFLIFCSSVKKILIYTFSFFRSQIIFLRTSTIYIQVKFDEAVGHRWNSSMRRINLVLQITSSFSEEEERIKLPLRSNIDYCRRSFLCAQFTPCSLTGYIFYMKVANINKNHHFLLKDVINGSVWQIFSSLKQKKSCERSFFIKNT